MTDLDKLIAAVEAGDESAMIAVNRRMASAARDIGKYWESNDTAKAFGGSLDAAKRLHDALLPGWRWIVRNTDQADIDRDECKLHDAGFSNVWGKGNPNEGAVYWHAFSTTPARAWLLVILRAVKAKGEAS